MTREGVRHYVKCLLRTVEPTSASGFLKHWVGWFYPIWRDNSIPCGMCLSPSFAAECHTFGGICLRYSPAAGFRFSRQWSSVASLVFEKVSWFLSPHPWHCSHTCSSHYAWCAWHSFMSSGTEHMSKCLLHSFVTVTDSSKLNYIILIFSLSLLPAIRRLNSHKNIVLN